MNRGIGGGRNKGMEGMKKGRGVGKVGGGIREVEESRKRGRERWKERQKIGRREGGKKSKV